MKAVGVDNTENGIQLSELVSIDSPKAVIDEVSYLLNLMSKDMDPLPVASTFYSVLDMFKGNHPGYRTCNTEYHDFQHTNQVFLTMARLIHGAVVEGESISCHQITLGLIAALFHDAGYIQETDDTTGTGAKHTATHVERSMDFFEIFGTRMGLDEDSILSVRSVILCTNLSVDISAIEFPNPRIRLLGKLIGTADVLAQMADRIYLEKLLFLYREFKESGIGGYESEVDLLRKTIGFYEFIARRLEPHLGRVDRFMKSHFIARWEIHENLYQTAIEKQRNYLEQILSIPNSDPRTYLKRGGIVGRIEDGEKGA